MHEREAMHGKNLRREISAEDPVQVSQIWVIIYLTYRKKNAIFTAWKA